MQKLIKTNDKIFERVYGNGKYDHLLNDDGTVNSKKYNEEQMAMGPNLMAALPGLVVFGTLIWFAIGGN